MSVNDIRARLASEITEPVFTADMTRAERRADMDRYLADCQAQSERLDEEHLLLGIGRTAAVCMTHELIWSWENATASRWYMALPERYMTPDDLRRADWNHSHYPHDEHGHTGRVTTLQRPETQADIDAANMIASILAELAAE